MPAENHYNVLLYVLLVMWAPHTWTNYLNIHHFYTKHWKLLDKISTSTKRLGLEIYSLERLSLFLYNIHLPPLCLLNNHISSQPSGELRAAWGPASLCSGSSHTLPLTDCGRKTVIWSQSEGGYTQTLFFASQRGIWSDSGAVLPALTKWKEMKTLCFYRKQ